MRREQGFTVIELLMAMAVFSFVMIIIVAAFIQIMAGYRQGVTSQNAQKLAREIIVEMTRNAQESDIIMVVPDASVTGVTHVCLGDRQYDYNETNRTLLLGTKSGDCAGAAASARSIVSNTSNFQVSKFVVEPKSSPNGTPLGASVRLTIATRTNDLLNGDGTVCDPTQSGSQFCSVTTIDTAMGLRED